MQAKRDKKIKQEEEEIFLKNEKKKQFMEKQAQRRQRIRQLESDDDDDYDKKKSDEEIHGKGDKEEEEEEEGEWDRQERIMQKNDKTIMRVGEKRCRPAWSLTESEANNTRGMIEAEEEEELMNFVDGLDFDQYFHDMELKVLMTQVKDRIHQLEKQKSTDESLLNAVLKSEAAEAHNRRYNNDNPMELSTDNEHTNEMNDNQGCTDDNNNDDDIKSIAQSIRNGDEGSMT